jgi:hypothetical protein
VILQSPVFLINSRYRLLFEADLSSGRKARHQTRHTIFQSYGVNLQSSLTRVISSALGFSPFLPVSVYGTITYCTCYVAFLESMESMTSGHTPTYSNLRLYGGADLPTLHPTFLNRHFHQPDHLSFSVPTSLKTHNKRYRNINLFSIDYAFRPRLRYRLTLGGLPLPRKP